MSQTEADAVGFCLSMGLLDLTDLAALVEREIANTARPSSELIELAFCTQRADAISQLHHMAKESVQASAAQQILAVLKTQWLAQQLSLRLVARVLEQMAQFGYLPATERPDVDCQWLMLTLAEDLFAVAAGDYSAALADTIRQQLLDFLSCYATDFLVRT